MTTTAALTILKIQQMNNTNFQIDWSDGVSQQYTLARLQRNCPCASCVDESSGQRISDPTRISDDLRARKIKSVGRYAIRIDFETGCSTGIFDYDYLRQLGSEVATKNKFTGWTRWTG